MTNPKEEYNTFIRANLPYGISYDSVRANYVTFNGKRFPTYLQARWYVDYIDKIGVGALDDLYNNLFANDEPSVWYDPSDLTTLFQDTAGTTPVTTPGQTVARINDKSGNGFNATQATAAARPTYGIEPSGGRRNLVRYTEDFSNWTADGASQAASETLAPDGTLTATEITGVSGNFRVYRTDTLPAGDGTLSVYVKRGTSATITLDIINVANGPTFNFDTLAFSGGFLFTGHTVEVLPDGWFRLSVSKSFTAGYAGPGFSVGGVGQTALIWHPQIEINYTATAYQKVVTQYEVTETGVPSVGYLYFDGVDDFMVTPTITPGTDKVQVFAGVRKLSDATAIILEHSPTTDSNNGSLHIAAIAASTANQFTSRGTTARSANVSGPSAPSTMTVTGLGDISGDSATQRRNGVHVSSSALDQGTGNYLAYPIYIGRRAGTSLPFNGHIYSLITRFGPNLTDASITKAETYVNSKTGAY